MRESEILAALFQKAMEEGLPNLDKSTARRNGLWSGSESVLSRRLVVLPYHIVAHRVDWSGAGIRGTSLLLQITQKGSPVCNAQTIAYGPRDEAQDWAITQGALPNELQIALPA